ncbi:12597_t:CDS:2 [Ambispora gerdemannii]|uniref:12597_t:CDS:1 n=1 Tax=Ambispora gerdemannii TaxID=144530 RepID=A0A9N8VCH4_9GLOM|nr:12597_t:CDS:2 [Ambispora gerdemannii]
MADDTTTTSSSPTHISKKHIKKQQTTHPLLFHSLNVFNLPPEILGALVSHNIVEDDGESETTINKEITESTLAQGGIIGISTAGCATCGGLVFDSVDEQREHYRTDFHRFNAKRKLFDPNVEPVAEEEFEEMLEEMTKSSSDTESTNSKASSQSSYDAVEALFKRHQPSTENDEFERTIHQDNSPYLWFSAPPVLREEIHLGIFKQIFPDPRHGDPIQYLKSAQIDGGGGDKESKRIWTMLMLSGGYFAGLVCALDPKKTGKDSGMEPIVHKRVQRYTVRRKQGGAQSAHDQAKGGAKSAGADLRRFNEAKLQGEVRELLENWKDWIEKSDLVFVSAPGANKNIIYGYEGAVLRRADPRIRSFPFSTKRPAFKELKRSFNKLTTVKVSELNAESLKKLLSSRDPAEELASKLESLAKITTVPAKSKKPEPPQEPKKPEQTEEVRKFIELIRKGKLDLMMGHMEKCAISPTISFETEEFKHTPTLLHVASSAGQPEIVAFFLEKHAADPTITSTTLKTPYDVALDKETRNAFRRYMAEHPDQWDWKMAHVPKGGGSSKSKQKDVEPPTSNQPPPKTTAIGQTLNKAISELVDTNLTPEMQARIDRERRARAAEARMAKLANRGSSSSAAAASASASSAGSSNKGLVCEMCKTSLVGKVPFARMQWQYCSTECVVKHRALVG